MKKLTLVFKRTWKFWWFWLEKDERKIWWRKEECRLEEKRMKSVEISRFFDIIKDIFLLLGYLHFSPSSSQSLPIKFLDFQFNPSLHNISITNHFIWKSNFTLSIFTILPLLTSKFLISYNYTKSWMLQSTSLIKILFLLNLKLWFDL